MKKPAYKGKNIRVREDAHELATNHCGKKIVLGEFVSEAIEEKIQREGIPTLDRQIMKQIEEFAPDLTKEPKLQGILQNTQDWPIKKETKA